MSTCHDLSLSFPSVCPSVRQSLPLGLILFLASILTSSFGLPQPRPSTSQWVRTEESLGQGPGAGSALSQLCDLVQLAHLSNLSDLLYWAIRAKGHWPGDLSNTHFLSGCSGGSMPMAAIFALEPPSPTVQLAVTACLSLSLYACPWCLSPSSSCCRLQSHCIRGHSDSSIASFLTYCPITGS